MLFSNLSVNLRLKEQSTRVQCGIEKRSHVPTGSNGKSQLTARDVAEAHYPFALSIWARRPALAVPSGSSGGFERKVVVR